MKRKVFMFMLIIVSLVLTMNCVSFASEFQGRNMVLNNSFESGTDDWTNWEGNYAVARETFHTGSKSIKIWASSSGANEQLLQNVKVNPGASYDFNAWVRVPSGQTVKASLLLSGSNYAEETLFTASAVYSEAKKDPSFTPNKVNGAAGDGHTVWQNIKGSITIPDEATFSGYVEGDETTYPNICIYFQYVTGGNWNRYAYIDDVSLERAYNKEDLVNSVAFYQDGIDITESGFTTGTVIADINMEDILINGNSPYIVVASYKDGRLLSFNSQTILHNVNDDGTINLTAELEITDAMVEGSNCSIVAFVWSDLDSMISLSDTYELNYIG